MTAIPDDILKAIAVATEAKIKAISFDSQISEDKLKYSNWMSALAIAALLMIASNFSDLRSIKIPYFDVIYLLLIVFLALSFCVVFGGIYYRKAIGRLKTKRQIMTLALKQHSVLLSSEHEIKSDRDLCGQVWDSEFLDSVDQSKLKQLKREDTIPDWLLTGQMISLVASVMLVFSALFLGTDSGSAML